MANIPSPLNYFIGKGILSWKGSTDINYRDLGNTPLFEITPQTSRKDHYSARKGIRFLDSNPVDSKRYSCKFHMEEWTLDNMALALMGTIDSANLLHAGVLDEVTGEVTGDPTTGSFFTVSKLNT